jgi:hypothetical protein
MKAIYLDEIPELKRNINGYFESIRRDHKTRLLRKSFSLYAWFWFHSEFWLGTLDRRPYTFIFRDWIFSHLTAYKITTGAWYAGLLIWLHWAPYPAGILVGLSSWLNAHLVWGSKWEKGEQEWPPYLGE